MKINIDKKAVGSRIKQIRTNKGYTLESFGKLFGASKSNVQKWETGFTLPNKERLASISKIADMTVNELLYGSIDEFLNNNLEQLKKRKLSSSPHYLDLNIKEIVKNYLFDNSKNINDISEIVNILEKDFDKIVKYAINEYIIENLNMLDKYKQLALEVLIDEPALSYAIFDILNGDKDKLGVYKILLVNNDITYNYGDLPSDFNSYIALKEILTGNNEKQKQLIYPFFAELIDFIKYKLKLIYSNDIMYEQIQSTIKNVLEKNDVYNLPYQEIIVDNLTNAIIDKIIEMAKTDN